MNALALDVWKQQTIATTFHLATHRSVEVVGNNERRLSLDFICKKAASACRDSTDQHRKRGR